LGHKPAYLKEDVIKKFLKDASKKGVKSVLFSGEGEGLLYKGLPSVVSFAKKCGMDVAFTTNAVLLSREISEQIIPHLTWLRISLNAGTSKTYSLVHGANAGDFSKVVNNIKEAVRIKKKNNYKCTIGIQLLLLNENYKEVGKLIGISRNLGVDYLILKPYSQHPLSINRLKTNLNYDKLHFLEKELEKNDDPNFKIIFRKNTISKINEIRAYKKCLGFPFYAHLTSEGDLYACSSFLGDNRFCYGNIYQGSFQDIWNGAKRKKIIEMMSSSWNITDCREVCRLDEINQYLWRLNHPPKHVNFI